MCVHAHVYACVCTCLSVHAHAHTCVFVHVWCKIGHIWHYSQNMSWVCEQPCPFHDSTRKVSDGSLIVTSHSFTAAAEEVENTLSSICHPGPPTLSIAILCIQWITTANWIHYEQEHYYVIPGPPLFGWGYQRRRQGWDLLGRERLSMLSKVHVQL